MPSWGRGGAGNILNESQITEQNRKVAEDLEANRSLASSAAPPATSPEPQNQYAHTGRGGAGNWYQPSELAKSGSFSQPADSTAVPTSTTALVSTPWHPEGQEMPIARAGRGGAGNFVWKDPSREHDIREEEERAKQKVRGEAERDVEAGLQRPDAAVLGGTKAGRGW